SNLPQGLATWIGGRTYPELFEEAFGTPDVTPGRIAMAIATHERTLFTDQTPIDQALAGIQPLTVQEQRGQGIFVNQCASCHAVVLVSGRVFRNIGVRAQNEDIGRNLVSGGLNDLG